MHPMQLSVRAAPAAPSPRPATNGAALRDYQAVNLEARVAGASPHQLILMLLERLYQQLRAARTAAEQGDRARRLQAIERSLALVDGLDMALDVARGGDVAQSLRRAYGLMRDGISDGALAEAQAMAGALSDAWRQIGPVSGRPVSGRPGSGR